MSVPSEVGSAGRASGIQMTAVTHDRYGPPEVLKMSRMAVPAPGPNEVLLRVSTSGISRGVWHMMTGLPRLVRVASGLRRPRQSVPGMDVCGEVVAVGSEVSALQFGQRVFGIARGSYAEYAVATASHVAPAPVEIDDREAGVLAESGLTALQALDGGGIDGTVRAGMRVLIIGASGGVGSLAVQIAALRGADVTAVCGGSKRTLVKSLGAARVIDYRTTDPLAQGERYDVILDGAGGASLNALRGALEPRGSLVFVGNESGGPWTGGYGRPFAYQLRMAWGEQRFVNLLVRSNSADLVRLADLARQGGLRPHVHASYPLSGVPAALEELASGAVAGKISIHVNEQENR